MEKRNHLMLNELRNALFKEELSSGKTEDSGSDSGTPMTEKYDKDFIMISGSEHCPGCEVPYTERALYGSGGSTPKPIHEEDEPERVVLVMDLPKPVSNWTMRVALENDEVHDEVTMTCMAGKYDSLYETECSKYKLVQEEPGVFFTIMVQKNSYRTYLNLNQPDQVAYLTHMEEKSFDHFRVSFLALTGA